tara:strand:- start:666 stop:875 length:210 start_codon:yes stop_codon:yes gene_type:complete
MKTPYRSILLIAMSIIIKDKNLDDLYDECNDLIQHLAEEEDGESNVFSYVNEEMFSILYTLKDKIEELS